MLQPKAVLCNTYAPDCYKELGSSITVLLVLQYDYITVVWFKIYGNRVSFSNTPT